MDEEEQLEELVESEEEIIGEEEIQSDEQLEEIVDFSYIKTDLGRPLKLKTFGPKELIHEKANKYEQICYQPDDGTLAVSAEAPTVFGIQQSQTPRRFLVKHRVSCDVGYSAKQLSDPNEMANLFQQYETDKLMKKIKEEMKHIDVSIRAFPFMDLFKPPFEEDKEMPLGESYMKIFRSYPDVSTNRRPIADLHWQPDNVEYLAAAYYEQNLRPWEQYDDRFVYIWNLRYRNHPYLVLDAGSPVTVLQYNEQNPNNLAGGTAYGQICLWDPRAGTNPVWITEKFNSFYDVATCMQWSDEANGKELTVGSLDGQIRWYDIRKWAEPFDSMIVDVTRAGKPKLHKSIGVTSYCFDGFIPTKFLAGTTAGTVIYGNRKGKNSEEKLGKVVFTCHSGPVVSVARNYTNPKYFLTAGAFLVKIWYDDYQEVPLFWTNYDRAMVTNASWSRVKNTVMVLGKQNGFVEVWDFLEKGTGPIRAVEVSKAPVTKAIINDFGELIAAGDTNGTITLCNISKHFGIFGEEEINQTTKWLERELKREKLLANKLKEIAIKAKKVQRPLEEEAELLKHYEQEGVRRISEHFNKVVADVTKKRGAQIGLWDKEAQEEN